MAVEVTLILRFDGELPPDLERTVEEELDCIVVEYLEDEI